MQLFIVIAGLLGLSAVGFAADLCSLDKKPSKTSVCVDLKAPVTPLAVELSPNAVLTIKIVNKSPLQDVAFEVKTSAIEDPTGKQFEALFRKLSLLVSVTPMLANAPIGIASVPPARKTKVEEFCGAGAADATPMANSAVAPAVKDPFRAAFTGLHRAQETFGRNQKSRQNCVDALLEEDVKSVKTLADHSLETISASTDASDYQKKIADARLSFGVRLNSAIEELKAHAPEKSSALDDVKARWERVNFLASSQVYLALPAGDQVAVDSSLAKALHAQNEIETGATALAEDESALVTALKLFKAVQKDTPEKWFELTQTFRAPENRKKSIGITWTDVEPTGTTKRDPIAFDATWKKVSPISMSLGFAFSSLAKTDFGLTAVRDASVLPTDPIVLKYKVSSTTVRPVTFPLALIHYDIPNSLPASRAGFAISGGAGVDVSGSSPTGEFAFGGSGRFRSLYFSGLLHLGRRKKLQSGFNLNDAAPAGFTPPTQDVWGKGFAFGLTYRLPL
jgi:hypothetical protein